MRRKVAVAVTLQLNVREEWSDEELRAYISNSLLQTFVSENRPPVDEIRLTFVHKDGRFAP